MSHYFESGFVVRDQAWHGLAKVLDNPPSVEEGIRAAGLAWTVEPSPIQALTPNGIVDGGPHRAIVRSDTGKVLAVMTDNYVPLQNVEAFEFFDPILQDGAVALEAAGALKEGRNVWVLAKVRGADADVVEGDRISGYLLLSNGHDGSQAVTVTYTPIRVVCWNTLSAALTGSKGAKKIRHTRNLRSSLRTVQGEISRTLAGVEKTVDFARAVRKVELDARGFYGFLESVYKPERVEARAELDVIRSAWNTADAEKRKVLAERGNALRETLEKPLMQGQRLTDLSRLFEAGPGADMAGRTAWGAINAITHYEEHARNGRSDNESRLASSWFSGNAARVRERAFQVAADMVSA